MNHEICPLPGSAQVTGGQAEPQVLPVQAEEAVPGPHLANPHIAKAENPKTPCPPQTIVRCDKQSHLSSLSATIKADPYFQTITRNKSKTIPQIKKESLKPTLLTVPQSKAITRLF